MKQNFYVYPPYNYLVQVADHCPKAVLTYMALWRDASSENKVNVFKKDIKNEYLTSLAKFRHDIFLLFKEGLVSIDETPQWLHIELINWDESVEDEAC